MSSPLSDTRLVTVSLASANVSAVIGELPNGQAAIEAVRLSSPLSSHNLALAINDLVNAYREAQDAALVAPLPRSHVSEALGAVFAAQREAIRKTYCRVPLESPCALDTHG